MFKKTNLILFSLLFLFILCSCDGGGGSGGKDYGDISEISQGDWTGTTTQTEPEKAEKGPLEFFTEDGEVDGFISHYARVKMDPDEDAVNMWVPIYFFATINQSGEFKYTDKHCWEKDICSRTIIEGEFTDKSTCKGSWEQRLPLKDGDLIFSGSWIATAKYGADSEGCDDPELVLSIDNWGDLKFSVEGCNGSSVYTSFSDAEYNNLGQLKSCHYDITACGRTFSVDVYNLEYDQYGELKSGQYAYNNCNYKI